MPKLSGRTEGARRLLPWLVLGAVAVAGLVVRAWPVVRAGAFAAGSDYDDAVNFSAAGLLLEGRFPYRDFFYAHPPGGVLALAPLAGLGRLVGYDRAFWMAGAAVMVVGALNVVLVGRLAWRAWGPVAGVASAVLYAVHPHVLVAERTTFMEPLLNLACITMANVWLGRGGDEEVSDRRALWTGVLAGIALSFKAWSAVWVVAVLVAVPNVRRRAVLGRFVAGFAAAGAVLVGPLALVGIGNFLEYVVGFHLWRPRDGTQGVLRVYEVFGFVQGNRNPLAGPHGPTSLLAVAGLGVALFRFRARRRADRLAATAYVLSVAWLLAAGVYYTHYNGHLALAEVTLAGLGVSAGSEAVRRVRVPALVGGVVVLAMAAAAVPVSLVKAREDARARTPENKAIGAELAFVPDDACVLAFEPVWTVSAGRLPSSLPGLGAMPDPYGAMLFAAIRAGARYPSVMAAFEDEPSQGEIREFLAGCQYLVLGWRGFWQLNQASEAELNATFQPRPAGPSGLEIWERRDTVTP